jgi:hypothetical protein
MAPPELVGARWAARPAHRAPQVVFRHQQPESTDSPNLNQDKTDAPSIVPPQRPLPEAVRDRLFGRVEFETGLSDAFLGRRPRAGSKLPSLARWVATPSSRRPSQARAISGSTCGSVMATLCRG